MSVEIEKMVLDYLELDKANYAVMITGKWGCGKTFYWEHTLKEKLAHDASFCSMYVSANGLSSIDDLSRKLLLAVLSQKHLNILDTKYGPIANDIINNMIKPIAENPPGLCDTAHNILGVLSGLADVKLKTSGLLEMCNFSKDVICIDDVERYQGNIEEFMGFCNQLLEHHNAHLILIANEEKLEEKSKTFRAIKEKVIGKTVQFDIRSVDMIQGILKYFNEKHSNVYKFLHDNISICTKALDDSTTKNYRVVTMVLKDFCRLYDHIDKISDLELNEAERDTAKRALLKFMLAAGLEIHAKGISEVEIMELRDAKSSMVQELTAELSDTIESTVKYYSSFKNRYYDVLFSERDFFPSAIDYLIKGTINEDELKKELEFFHEAKLSVYDYILSIGYWNMSDDYFEANVNGVLLDEIASGDAPIQVYKKLFLYYAEFVAKGLTDITIHELESKFRQGLHKIKEAGNQEPPEYDSTDIFMRDQFVKLSSESKEAFNRIQTEIDAISDILKQKTAEKASMDFIVKLKADFEGAIRLLIPNNQIKFINGPLFSKTQPSDVYNILKNQSNKNIIDFRNALINRQQYCSIETKRQDSPFLMELANLIEDQNNSSHKKMLSQALLLKLAFDIKRQASSFQ